jgi:hypothetical protein
VALGFDRSASSGFPAYETKMKLKKVEKNSTGML